MADVFKFPDNFLIVGKVAKPQGLKGEVRIHAFSDEPTSLLQYKRVVLVDSKGTRSPMLRIENARMQGKALVYKLERVDNRDDAEEIFGMGVLLDKEDLGNLQEDEYYWYQLYDKPVHTASGRYLGIVTSIFSNGAQDIMIVQDKDKEYLIPILEETMNEYTEEGVVITPTPGLLEMNDGDME